MPASIVKSFASRSGKPEAEVERLWNKAKSLAAQQGFKEKYDYIVGILKKMLKLEDLEGGYDELLAEGLDAEDYAVKQNKQVDLFLGRMQPFHKAHEKRISSLKNPVVAIVRGKGTGADKKRNPLSAEDQQKLIKKVFPNAKVIIVETGYIPDINNALRKMGMEVRSVISGEDRTSSYQKQIVSFNKQMPPEKQMDVKFIAAKRGDVKASGTEVRQSLIDNDEETFKAMMPKALHGEFKWLKQRI